MAVLLNLMIAATGLGLSVARYHKAPFRQAIITPFAYKKNLSAVSFYENLNVVFWEGGKLLFRDDIPANSKTLLIPLETYFFIENQLTKFQTETVNVRANGMAKHLANYQIQIIFHIDARYAVEKAKTRSRFKIIITWDKTGAPVFEIALFSDFTKGSGTATTALFNGLIPKGADLTRYYFSDSLIKPNADGTDAGFAWTIDRQTGAFFMLNKAVIGKRTLEALISEVVHSAWPTL